jgi:O-antigen/teichoic acid export membrane protein
MLFYSVYQPLHQSIYGLNRPGISFRLSAVGAIANLLLALALIPWLGIVGAAVGTSISQAVVMVGGIYILARSNSVDLDLSTRPWIIQVVSSVAMTGVLFALRITIESYTVFTLALVILASGLLYVTCVVMLDETVRHQLRDLKPVL